MHKVILKKGIEIKKSGLINCVVIKGVLQKQKPWLMDIFSFAYDFLMEKNVFPKKLSADISIHKKKNKKMLAGLRGKKILELGTGSGNLCSLIDHSNDYVGVDVSKGLLKKAGKRFKNSGKRDFELFLVSAGDLPFADNSFDFAFCNLSFNFFPDAQLVVSQIKRVLKKDGKFFCSVPIPERNTKGTEIHGTLRSAKELETLFAENDFDFREQPPHNGAIFYFTASKAAV